MKIPDSKRKKNYDTRVKTSCSYHMYRHTHMYTCLARCTCKHEHTHTPTHPHIFKEERILVGKQVSDERNAEANPVLRAQSLCTDRTADPNSDNLYLLLPCARYWCKILNTCSHLTLTTIQWDIHSNSNNNYSNYCACSSRDISFAPHSDLMSKEPWLEELAEVQRCYRACLWSWEASQSSESKGWACVGLGDHV